MSDIKSADFHYFDDVSGLRIKFPEIKTVPDDYFLSQEEYLSALKMSAKRILYDATNFIKEIDEISLSKD